MCIVVKTNLHAQRNNIFDEQRHSMPVIVRIKAEKKRLGLATIVKKRDGRSCTL
jgi:hypothetical protein